MFFPTLVIHFLRPTYNILSQNPIKHAYFNTILDKFNFFTSNIEKTLIEYVYKLKYN